MIDEVLFCHSKMTGDEGFKTFDALSKVLQKTSVQCINVLFFFTYIKLKCLLRLIKFIENRPLYICFLQDFAKRWGLNIQTFSFRQK